MICLRRRNKVQRPEAIEAALFVGFLELPLRLRLEPIDLRHPDTVALLWGPLVLMAVKRGQNAPMQDITRSQLLSARRVSERQWEVRSANGPVILLPFTSLGSRPYTTYLNVL